MAELIGIGIVFLGMWGSLWYKIGKLTSEVKSHNTMLGNIQKQVESLLFRGGSKDGRANELHCRC